MKYSFFVILPLCLRTIGVNICLALTSPFLPKEALSKGVPPIKFCLFFAVFNLCRIIFGAFWIIMINRKRASCRFMFNMGTILIAVCTVTIGYMQFVDNYFFTFVLLLRIILAFNSSAFNISLYAILHQEFPSKIGFAFGFLEMVTSIAYIFCLPVAGLVYDLGGYHLPSLIYGFVLLAISLSTQHFIPAIPNTPTALFTSSHLLKIPSIWTALLLVGFTELSFMFIAVLLEINVLRLPGGTHVVITAMFSANKISFVISSVVTGNILDKFGCLGISLGIALFLKFFAFLLWTSPHLLPNKQSVGQVAALVIISGLADGLLLTGSFAMLKDNASAYCIEENSQAYAMVSGSYNFILHFGSFIGSITAGVLQQGYGIEEASEVMMTLCAVLILSSAPFILDASRNSVHVQKKQITSILHFGSGSFQRLPVVRDNVCEELMKSLYKEQTGNPNSRKHSGSESFHVSSDLETRENLSQDMSENISSEKVSVRSEI